MKTQQPQIIHIAIVDNHNGIADTIAKLALFADFVIDIKAHTSEELIRWLEKCKTMPHICILELGMPGMDGYKILLALAQRCPQIMPLVLTDVDNKYAVRQALEYGAAGYLHKHCSAAELTKALRDINDTGYYISEIISHSTRHAVRNDKHRMQILSDREMDYLRCSCSGGTDEIIGKMMNVGIETVHGYRKSLYRKLEMKPGTHTKSNLVLFAKDMGFRAPADKE